MANYRIVCVTKEADRDPAHQHIISVGTGDDPDKATLQWSLDEVLQALVKTEPDYFYTESISTRKRARVKPFHCGRCGRTYLTTIPDHVTDNNLDNLRKCSWRS